MKKNQSYLVLGLAGALGFAGAALAARKASSSGGHYFTVSVKVVNATTGSIVYPASVQLGSIYALTATDGVAILDGVPAGSWSLQVTANGYQPVENETVNVSANQSLTVKLTPGTGCQATQCFCNEYFDTSLCVCAPLTPALIKVPLQASMYANFVATFGCLSGQTAFGFLSDSYLSSCPSSPPGFTPGTGTIQTVFSGVLISANNLPICNETIAIPGSTTMPWTSADGVFTGTISIYTPGYVITDSNGQFSVSIQVGMFLDAAQTALNEAVCSGYIYPLQPPPCCGILHTQTVYSLAYPLELALSLQSDQTVQAVNTTTINLEICCYYNFGG